MGKASHCCLNERLWFLMLFFNREVLTVSGPVSPIALVTPEFKAHPTPLFKDYAEEINLTLSDQSTHLLSQLRTRDLKLLHRPEKIAAETTHFTNQTSPIVYLTSLFGAK